MALIAIVIFAVNLSAQSYDGTWTGTTGQGRPFSFVVQNSKIMSFTIDLEGSAAGCTSSVQSTLSFQSGWSFSGNTFSYSNLNVTGNWGFAVAGTFTSGSTANGTLQGKYTTIFGVPGCPATATTTWTATNGSAPACTFQLSQTAFTIPADGGSRNVSVNNTAGSGCSWSTANPASWIQITAGGAGGTGSGTVSFSALANTSTSQRSATLTIAGQPVTVTQSGVTAPPTGGGLRFVPLTPCRLVDTRAAYAGPRTGSFGPPLLSAGVTRTIPITASTTCSVPPSAKAYVFNVTLDTMENQTDPVDFLTIWPTGETRPEFFTARTTTGGYIANAAIVKAGTGGAVNVHTSNDVNLILDINGYFTDEGSAGLLYYPISPCRAVDTRGPVYSSLPSPYGNQRFQARENRTFRLPGSPACQIPVASAYSLQLTLAPGELTNGNPVAFITAYPTGVAQPNISNMNAFFGYAVANSAIVPASANGSVDVYAYDATNLIIDVNGYFAPDDGTGRGLFYFPVTQCRVVNTQDATYNGSFGPPALSNLADRTVPIPSGHCTGLPTTARAWALNTWVVPGGVAMPYLSLWPTGTAWPNISQLNAFQGQTVANSCIVPASGSGSIDVRVAAPTHTAVEVAGYFSR